MTRDRTGRDLAFLCQIYNNGWSTAPRDIAIDEQTAFLLDSSGHGTIVGIGMAYFLQAPGRPQVCQAKTPLTYQNIAVYRINSTGTFNVANWTGTNGVSYAVSPTRAC